MMIKWMSFTKRKKIRPKIHVTGDGGLRVDPNDIVRSEKGQEIIRQLREIRKKREAGLERGSSV